MSTTRLSFYTLLDLSSACFVGHCGFLHSFFFFFQAEDGIRDLYVTGVQTYALPILFSISSAISSIAFLHATYSGSVIVRENNLDRRIVYSESKSTKADSSAL